MHNEVLYEAGM